MQLFKNRHDQQDIWLTASFKSEKKYKNQKYIRSISLISYSQYTAASHIMLYFCRMTGLKSVKNEVNDK